MPNIKREGEAKTLQQAKLVKGEVVTERSFVVLVIVGIVEVLAGTFSLSVALIADGIYSFADAVVSLIIWVGLRLSRKAPDGKFHFGYYRVETFSSVVAAFFMMVLGGVIIYQSYQVLLAPREVMNAEIAMLVALSATVVASGLLIYKARSARKNASLALKTDVLNSVKDVLTSLAAFSGIVMNKYLHIMQADAIAGIVIALFVFTVSYSTVKEASLVLMDACQCSDILSEIEAIAKSVRHVKDVHNIRMRKLGSYLIGDMHVVVDGDMPVREADQVATLIEEQVKQKFDEVTEIKIRIEPHQPKKAA